jgi:hypothetical protein
MRTYLAYGGGVCSTALAILHKDDIDEMIFVDHGGDYPETLAYVSEMEKRGFPIHRLIPKVEGFSFLYDYCYEKRILPHPGRRWCTDKFKIRPITAYVHKPCIMYIGYTKNEERRINLATVKRFLLNEGIRFRYPLVDEGITRDDAKKIVTDFGLDLPPKSHCYFCPFMLKEEARSLYLNHKDLFAKCVVLEERTGYNVVRRGSKITLWLILRHFLPFV